MSNVSHRHLALLLPAVYIPNGLSQLDFHPEEKVLAFTKTGSIRISVKDSGHGISAEDQKSLFTEGLQFRANQLQAGGGSGLGLWISKGVTELHYGSLEAFSEGEGLGTTFVLELPVGTPHTPPAPPHPLNTSSPPDKATGKYSPKNNMGHGTELVVYPERDLAVLGQQTKRIVTLMCVDDSAPSRKLMVKMLERGGYICHQAYDGMDCLKKMKALAEEGVVVDAVLMDFEMPNLNGPDATRELARRGCDTLVIGITGNVLPEDIQTFLDSGAYDVLGKPFAVEKLEKLFSSYGSRSFCDEMSVH